MRTFLLVAAGLITGGAAVFFGLWAWLVWEFHGR